MRLCNSGVECRKAEPTSHVFPPITARDSIAPAMACQRIIDILVHASRAQRVLEAVPKRMKDAVLVVDAERALISAEPFLRTPELVAGKDEPTGH
jgi:hypothetical protein